MKILIIPTWYKNEKDLNAGIFIKEQALELNKNNEVIIYFPYDDFSKLNATSNIEDNLLTFRSKWLRGKIPIIPNIVNKIVFNYNIKKIIKIHKPDVVHAHVSTQAGYLANIIYKKFKVPYVVTEHAPKKLLITNQREANKAKKIFKDSFKSIGVSKYICNDLREIGNLECINNGIKNELEENDEYMLNDNSINIAVVASFYNKSIKGIDYLLRSLNLINLNKIKVHIIGDGQFKNYYEKYATELNLNNIVKFYGYLEKNNTLNLIKQCDFLVSASLEETFGIAIAEALILGKPVVSTKAGGPEEFINSDVGVLIEAKNENELAKAIVYMAENYNKYDSEYIKAYANNTLGMDQSIAKYNQIYLNLNKKG